MNIEIFHQPDSAIARINSDSGEELVALSGRMIAMSSYINASTTLRQGKGGGVLGGLKRLVGGESLFLSVLSSPKVGGEIFLALKFMGDILHYPVTGMGLVVQST